MEIPETAVGLLVGAGVVLILASILGGGLEVKEIKIPTISSRMRLLAFTIGVALIALPIVPLPGLDPGRNDRAIVDEPDESEIDNGEGQVRPMELGDLTGIPESEARRRIRNLGLTVGQVSRRSEWAPDGSVVAHSAAATLTPEEPIDLTVAESQFRFRSSRQVKSENEEISAVAEYIIRRLPEETASGDIAEVSLTRLAVEPDEGRMRSVVERLVGSSMYVRLDDLEHFDLAASWEVLADLQLELGDSMATASLIGDDQDFSSLGEGILLALLGIELTFDVRAILTPPPRFQGDASDIRELQPGSRLASLIRVQGEPGTVAAGQAVSFEVARRLPQGDGFRTVGRATYATRDGLLRSLSASFFLGTTEDTYLQLKIERM